jgi:hypothetical protein
MLAPQNAIKLATQQHNEAKHTMLSAHQWTICGSDIWNETGSCTETNLFLKDFWDQWTPNMGYIYHQTSIRQIFLRCHSSTVTATHAPSARYATRGWWALVAAQTTNDMNIKQNLRSHDSFVFPVDIICWCDGSCNNDVSVSTLFVGELSAMKQCCKLQCSLNQWNLVWTGSKDWTKRPGRVRSI